MPEDLRSVEAVVRKTVEESGKAFTNVKGIAASVQKVADQLEAVGVSQAKSGSQFVATVSNFSGKVGILRQWRVEFEYGYQIQNFSSKEKVNGMIESYYSLG